MFYIKLWCFCSFICRYPCQERTKKEPFDNPFAWPHTKSRFAVPWIPNDIKQVESELGVPQTHEGLSLRRKRWTLINAYWSVSIPKWYRNHTVSTTTSSLSRKRLGAVHCAVDYLKMVLHERMETCPHGLPLVKLAQHIPFCDDDTTATRLSLPLPESNLTLGLWIRGSPIFLRAQLLRSRGANSCNFCWSTLPRPSPLQTTDLEWLQAGNQHNYA